MAAISKSTTKRIIRSKQVLLGYDNATMAKKLGLTPSAYQRRLRSPGMITLSEAAQIDEILNTNILSQKITEQNN